MCESHNIIKVNMYVVRGGRFKKVFIDSFIKCAHMLGNLCVKWSCLLTFLRIRVCIIFYSRVFLR